MTNKYMLVSDLVNPNSGKTYREENTEWPAWATAESIVDAVCVCDKCGWRGTVRECKLDGSSLVCAECLAALDTSEERLKANEQS